MGFHDQVFAREVKAGVFEPRRCFLAVLAVRSRLVRARSRGTARAAGASGGFAGAETALSLASDEAETTGRAWLVAAADAAEEVRDVWQGPAMSEARARSEACRMAGSRPARHKAC